MIKKEINKGDKGHSYKFKQQKKRKTLYILNNISEHVTLVQMMETIGNIYHAVSISGFWIYNPNNKKALPLVKE